MLRTTLIFILVSLPAALSAQYGRIGMLEFATGPRIGYGIGVSGQYFHTDYHVFEGILYSRWKGLSATALYEHHMPVLDARGVKWYIGAGAHAMVFPVGTNRPDIEKQMAGNVFVPGLDAIIGLEYFFPGTPFQVSLDLKPEYNFGILRTIDFTNGGFTVRYRF